MSYNVLHCYVSLAVLTVYGNGWQTVLQFIGLCWGLCWSSSQENSPHRLWKWLANSPPIYRTVLGTVLEQFSGKQSSPLMEMVAPQRRIYFGRTQNDYRIALDKKSHFSKETTVTMPHSQKFPLLMSF